MYVLATLERLLAWWSLGGRLCMGFHCCHMAKILNRGSFNEFPSDL
jgi:hypothetical protein